VPQKGALEDAAAVGECELVAQVKVGRIPLISFADLNVEEHQVGLARLGTSMLTHHSSTGRTSAGRRHVRLTNLCGSPTTMTSYPIWTPCGTRKKRRSSGTIKRQPWSTSLTESLLGRNGEPLTVCQRYGPLYPPDHESPAGFPFRTWQGSRSEQRVIPCHGDVQDDPPL
jgi:hypothetical protein